MLQKVARNSIAQTNRRTSVGKLWRADLPTPTRDSIRPNVVGPHVNSWLTVLIWHLTFVSECMRAKRVILYVPKSRNYGVEFQGRETLYCISTCHRIPTAQTASEADRSFLDTSSEKKRFLLLLPVHGTVIRLRKISLKVAYRTLWPQLLHLKHTSNAQPL